MIINLKDFRQISEERFDLYVFVDNNVAGGVDTFLRLLLPRLFASTGHQVLFVNSTFPNLQDFARTVGPHATIVTYSSRLSVRSSNRSTQDLLQKVKSKTRGLLRRTFEYCYLPLEVLRLRRSIKLNCDVPALMINGGYPGSYAVLAASIAFGKHNPVLLNIHNLAVSPSFISAFFDRVIDLFVRRRVDRFVTVSETCKRYLDNRLLLDSETSLYIYNAIELPVESLKDQVAEETNTSSRPVVLGLVGTLEERKGHQFALSILKSLIDHQTEKSFSLKIVGSDPMSRAPVLKRLACELGIDHLVEFVGFKTGRKQIYDGIDLLLVPSTRSESFGFVAIEALAEGIPVVASSTGALAEILEEVSGCSVVHTWDVEDWITAIIGCVQQKPSHQALVRSAKYVRFTNPDQMIAEYQQLLADYERAQ